jgi:translation elongation factor EF-1beta
MSKKQKQQRARSPRRPGSSRRRWLLLPLGFGVTALALYVAAQSGTQGTVAVGPAPLDHIDDASRVRLERVLRDAELREAR